MSDDAGISGGSSSYPGSGDPPPPPPHGQGPPPAYPGQQPPAYPGQQPPAYPGQQPPAYWAPPPNYPGGGYGMPPPPGQQSGWSGLAIAAFVASLVPLVGILAAVPLAIVALVKISKTRQRGKGLAITAIVVSVLWWIGFIALAVWLAASTVDRNGAGEISAEGRIDFGEIRVGDCVHIPDPAGSGDVNTFELRGLPCSEPHNAEAAAVIALTGDSYPGSGEIDKQTASGCSRRAQSYLNGASSAGLQPYRLIPTESIWNDDNGHRVICFITRIDYADMTGSVADK